MSNKYVVVDAQFHYIPPEATKLSSEPAMPEGKGLLAQLHSPAYSATYARLCEIDKAVQHMNACGMDMALVGMAPWTAVSLEGCKVVNDGLARLAKDYPGKFIPLAHVPCLAGQAALDELDRAIGELGLKGVTVLTSMQDVRLDDPLMRPFFKKVNQLRVPVEVHPTVKTPLWGGEKYYMSGSVSREYEIIKAFVEVLCGVLPEFPDLNFVFAHYGGGVPLLLGRIMSWYCPSDACIPADRVGRPKTIREFEELMLKDGFEKLLDRMYIDTAGTGGWLPAVRQSLLAIKPERVCFATDYPFELSRPDDLKAYIQGVIGLEIPEVDKANILGGNIRRLFNA